ncbi:MAG: ATP-dependent Clp protease proteolytic subunit [Akkermansia sp.]|nr:ATP-dependent Clp protease proteolytic subunit [Akkermansia sp.]
MRLYFFRCWGENLLEVIALEQLKELGQQRQGSIHCLSIIGQIEGHQVLPDDIKTTKYEHLLPTIAAIEESEEIKGLLILINTVGGDVEAGLAIAELIAGMKKPTVSLVLGGGHSIGVPLAVAARRSIIAPSASMTLHPVRINGLVIGVPQSYEYLKSMQDRVTDFIVSHSNISREKYTGLIYETSLLANDVGTIVSGKEAVSLGLMDACGGLSDALSYLHNEIEQGL